MMTAGPLALYLEMQTFIEAFRSRKQSYARANFPSYLGGLSLRVRLERRCLDSQRFPLLFGRAFIEADNAASGGLNRL